MFALFPMISQSHDRKTTKKGAMSSCSVHPRVCHRELLNADVGASKTSELSTS